MALTAEQLWNTTGTSFLPSQVAALNALGDVPSGTSLQNVPPSTQAPLTTNVSTSGSLGGDFLNSLTSPFRTVGHMVGYTALAYGIYKLMKTRKLSLTTAAILAFGVWGSGLWDRLKQYLPKNSDGSTNYLALAGMAMPNSTVKTAAGIGLAGGTITAASLIVPLVVGWLSTKLFSKGRTYKRSYSRPRYYSRRRYSYRRR